MRPALQRLLQRPSSLDILRQIVSTPTCFPVLGRKYCSQMKHNSHIQSSTLFESLDVVDNASDKRVEKSVLDEIEANTTTLRHVNDVEMAYLFLTTALGTVSRLRKSHMSPSWKTRSMYLTEPPGQSCWIIPSIERIHDCGPVS